MINRAIVTGRLARDVDLRYTQSGKAVGRFTIAVNRRFKDANGERQADFINCQIWGKSAESFSNFMHKGSLVGLEGTIQTGSYENKQGQKVFTTDINVDNWSFLESNNQNNTGYKNGNTNYRNNPQPSSSSFNNNHNNNFNAGMNHTPTNPAPFDNNEEPF